MGYQQVRLGAMPGLNPSMAARINAQAAPPPRLSEGEVARMTAEQNSRIAAAERKIGRKLLNDEKLQVIAQVQREFGLKPRFDDPLPKVPVLFPGGPAFSWGTFGTEAVNRGTEVVNRAKDAPSSVISYAADQVAKGLSDAGRAARDRLGIGGIALLAGAAALFLIYSTSRR